MPSDKKESVSRSVRIRTTVVEAVTEDCKVTGVPIGRFFELAAKSKLSASRRRKTKK